MEYIILWLLFGIIGFFLWLIRRFRCKRYDDVFDSESDYYGEDGGFLIFITFVFIIFCGLFLVIYNLLAFFGIFLIKHSEDLKCIIYNLANIGNSDFHKRKIK